MPCVTSTVTDYTTTPTSYRQVTTCWLDTGGGSDTYRPPTGGGSPSSGGSSGISTGPGPGFEYDPTNPTGSVVVAAPPPPDTPAAPAPTDASMNFGWNSGAHSVETLPSDWVGRIVFDVPDVQGARPGGVAIGLAPVSALPVSGRNGYAHLRYGLVFTADEVRVISGGAQVDTVPYVDILGARIGGYTDEVEFLMYGYRFALKVNSLYLHAGAFSMPGSYALDATLFTAFDAVDNPAFIPGAFGEDGVLSGLMSGFSMVMDAYTDSSLVLPMQGFAAQFSELATCNLFGEMRGFRMDSGVGEGITGTMGPFSMAMADTATYTTMVGSFGPFGMVAGMSEPDSGVGYSVLSASMQRFGMSMTFAPTASLEASMRPFEMRASSESSYSELLAPMQGFRLLAYGGEMTPLVQVMEVVGAGADLVQSTYVTLAVIERIDGTSTAVLSLTMTADAVERISAESEISALQTYLASTMEQVGVLERVRVAVLRDAGGAPGPAIDDSEAWVVNTASSATTRYGSYGFNSFAAFSGKHFGAKPDGVYLLEGATDAGQAITSGVSLGQHDFGTQALKHISAVHVGVSSQGSMFLKVGDGTSSYTYRARRVDPHMKVQRFDIGRGLRTNYFTFELTNESDAFELDSVRFEVLASQRRI
ncbi:hypothetical protein AcdelDRAFT_0888 [Acidovorax delafieldii 2AN]|uniref:Uncharacterized protein n=1 Tax=Acidovorax delafieldii 2AN TaxID=573060 RepID=C5T1V8_ACIDE|nr:hypothetical protein [Acidovorax delafieldii]EER61553.1 hypothetical protein AcdelDRAFT_0888 [Acidovorax delafieldii 2AN]